MDGRRRKGAKPVNLVAHIVGALAGIVYVGFFAYKVGQLPLTIIVVACLAVMVYSFYDDIRRDRTIARLRRENGRPQ